MTRLKKSAPKVLLGLLILLFVVNPLAEELDMPGLGYLIDALLTAVLMMALYAEDERFSWKRPGVWFVLLAWLLRTIATGLNSSVSLQGYKAFLIVTEVYTAGLIIQIGVSLVRQLTRGGKVKTNTVAGIAAVYVLLAIGFGSLHIAAFVAQGADEPAFNGFEHDLAQDLQSGESSISKWGPELMYYSVVTQTTLGYGDMTPRSNLARGLAMIQTIVGQLYLAIVMARIVGMEISQRQSGDWK